MQRNYICIKRFASCCSRIQYINSFLLINPILLLSNKFYPRRAEKTIVRKFSHPACRSTSAP